MKKWNKLDNAAKIFPSTIELSETRVFRFYCELTEDIQPQVLQQAVEQAVKQFPQFLKILRTGLFWYYLESSNLTPVVKEESQTPCSHIYRYGHQGLLFTVTYYKKRINLEVFHVLADGTGAIEFLKFILAAYINLLHPDTLAIDDPLLVNTNTVEDMDLDAFEKYYTGDKNPRKIKKSRVFRFHGKRRPDMDLNITEGVVSVQKVLELAHQHQATMTEFLVAVFIRSLIQNMTRRELKKTLVIDIPINLRNFFPSVTTRNFFVMLPIEYRPSGPDDSIQDICQKVSAEFAKIITVENLSGRINSYGSFERNIPMRLVPLFLKDPGLRLVNFVTKRFITGCFSNLGRITLPEALDPYVNQWGIYSSTLNIQAECVSFQDRLTIGFTNAFYDATVIYTFFQHLKDMGAAAELHTNTPVQTPAPDADRRPVYWADPKAQTEPDPDSVFPKPKTDSNKIRTGLKWANISSILAVIVYSLIYIITKRPTLWIIILYINTFYIWSSVVSGVLNKKSVLRKLFQSFTITSVIYVAIDILTGWEQWSLNLQVPIFALVNIFLSIYLSQMFRTDTTGSELILYMSWECMIGLVPFILTLVGVLSFSLLPIAVGLVCVLLLLLMIIFRWRSMKHEYQKTFHF